MQCNVGGIDRTARFIAGIALLFIALLAPLSAVWKTILVLLAAVAIATAALRFCPGSWLLGIKEPLQKIPDLIPVWDN